MNQRIRLPAFLALVVLLYAIGLPPVWAEIIGHWSLNEGSGTTAADSSSFGNDATLTGTQNWVSGVIGGGFDFPGGGNTRFEASIGAELPTGAAERTISAWINPDSAADQKFVNYGSGSGGVLSLTHEGGGVRFRHGGGNITYGSVQLNEWTHVAIRIPAGASLTGDADVFIDGLEASVTGTQTGGTGVALNTASSVFRIGNSGSTSFDGSVDDVAFWDHALTDGEIAAIVNLALEPDLNYDANQADQLFQLFAGDVDEVEIGDLTWVSDTGLGGNAGDVVDLGDGNFFLNLNGIDGVSTLSAVPEPASVAIWTILGFALVGFGYYRNRLGS